ncbi:hypothetical protein SK128_010733 [Halocaridina rubra]|uniref:Uncharacterized protein n=1 Tax=Halocaridina rubra TaxID=373956 RepID=A0AAN8XGW3_HALRR
MADLQKRPQEKQLIQFWMCMSLEVQRVLEYSLGISPDTDLLEVDLCSGDPVTSAGTQLKIVVLMGVRDEELIKCLILMETWASLKDVLNCCYTNEATQGTASAIHSSPSQLCTISSYKRTKSQTKEDSSHRTSDSGHRENPPTSHPTSVKSGPCQFCEHQHGPGKCPTAEVTCHNCGNTAKCTTKDAQCHFCSKTGHYDKCCRTKMKDNGQGGSSR